MTPVENPRVTSPYGPRISPISGRTEQHNGQDIVDTKGNLNLRVIWDTVKTEYIQGYNGGRGNTAYLYYSDRMRVLYQHCASFSPAVLAQKPLKQGDSVGTMGTTGDSTGTHLHIEVQVLSNGKWVPTQPASYTEVPNSTGVHPGNNHLDNAEAPAPAPAPTPAPTVPDQTEAEDAKRITISGPTNIGYISKGDVAAITSLAKKLGLRVTLGKIT